MHRVRQWAHSSAHENKYNPWFHVVAIAAASGDSHDATINSTNGPTLPTTETEKPKTKKSVVKRFNETLKKIALHSWVNVLLIFVPIGMTSHFAHLNPSIVFAMNAVAIIPLAGLLTYATESVAHRLGDTLGALLNVSFGNAVELIILIALVKNEIRIVQASLLGSMLANLLLILGMAFILGGLNYREQIYNATVTQLSACLLSLAVLSLLIPTAFHASFSSVEIADKAVLKVSRGTSVILLLTYILYLLFQLKSHAYLYASTPQHKIDEESEPGILRRMHSSSSSSTASIISLPSQRSGGSKRRISRKLKSKLGIKRHVKIEEDVETRADAPPQSSASNSRGEPSEPLFESPRALQPQEPMPSNTVAKTPSGGRPLPRGLSFRPPPVFRAPTDPTANGPPNRNLRPSRSLPTGLRDTRVTGSMNGEAHLRSTTEKSSEPPMSRTASMLLLLGSTALVAICAEFLVDSINYLVETSPISEAFIGLIILPIVGNAAEHVTAVTVAAKNKMDLAIGVAIGSSIQIALFITPVVVILGWILDKEMSLFFTLFETATLFVSTFVVNFLVLDGRSNYLEGVLLTASYIIIAVGAFYFPDGEDQNRVVGGV